MMIDKTETSTQKSQSFIHWLTTFYYKYVKLMVEKPFPASESSILNVCTWIYIFFFHFPNSKVATLCPLTHAYPISSGKSCSEYRSARFNRTSLPQCGGAYLTYASPSECSIKGTTVECQNPNKEGCNYNTIGNSTLFYNVTTVKYHTQRARTHGQKRTKICDPLVNKCHDSVSNTWEIYLTRGHLFHNEGHLFEMEGHLFDREGLIFYRKGHLFWERSKSG